MWNKIFFPLFIIIFSLSEAYADNCFVAKENGKIVKQEGKCDQRHSPFSTFKIPLALMGFDSGVLSTLQEPLVKFTQEIKKNFEPWYYPQNHPIQRFGTRAQTPASWMKYSVIWYSHYITQKLGVEKFQKYVNQFNYGNKDLSGTPEKNDGLLSSWLQNSLQITPLEQVAFIEKLSNRKLPTSKQAQENTIKLIEMENVWDDWKLYGKTAGGKPAGWFVGWVEKGHRRIVFAQYIEQPKDSLLSGGRVAKELAKDNLISMMLPSQ